MQNKNSHWYLLALFLMGIGLVVAILYVVMYGGLNASNKTIAAAAKDDCVKKLISSVKYAPMTNNDISRFKDECAAKRELAEQLRVLTE